MYQLMQPFPGQTEVNAIFDTVRRICIPFDPANTDCQVYLKWVAEGNTPQPAD